MSRTVVSALRVLLAAAALCGTSSPPAFAQSADAKDAIASLAFLLGTWQSGAGTVADTGQTSTGNSTFTSEANGAAMLRRDHTDLFDRDGKPAGSFDQLMMIYADGAHVQADYTDGTHVIHYARVTVVPNHSATFDTASQAGAPSYRLTYALSSEYALAVRFEIAPPGQTQYHPIASGSLVRGAK